MTQNGNGPKCPQIARLRQLQDVVSSSDIPQQDEHDLLDALEWVAVMLENRSLYHKKQQIKKKIIFAMASERGLIDEVNSLTDSVLHKHVSNQAPDREDELELNLGNLTAGDDDEN